MPEEISLSDLDQRLQKQVENAESALKKGNPAYAVDVCSRILEMHPGCIDVRRLLRKAQKQTHTTKSAFLAKAIGGVTNASFLLKGSSSLVKTDPLKAIHVADKMLRNTPSYTVALRMLGHAAEALNLRKTAVLAYEEIREIEPNNVENLLQLGKAYIEAGEPKRAVQLGDEILQIKPNFADAETLIKDASVALTMRAGWENDGEEQRATTQGQQETAQREQESRLMRSEDVMIRMVEETRSKIESDPENMNHRRSLIDNLRKLDRFKEALEAVQDARKTTVGSQDVTLDKLEGDIQLDILRQKLSDIEAQLEQDSDNQTLQKQVEELRVEVLEHRLERAKDMVERYPNDFILRFNLGEILLESKQYDAAIAQFQLAQRNPKVRLRALQSTGLAFKAKNQLEFAIEQLQKAKEEIPSLNEQKKEVIYELGLCFEALGQQEKAIGEYRTIYSADISYRDVADKINQYYSNR